MRILLIFEDLELIKKNTRLPVFRNDGRFYFFLLLTSSKFPNRLARVAKNSELKGAHFEIFQGFSSNFAKNVRFLYYREANKKRHVPLHATPITLDHS